MLYRPRTTWQWSFAIIGVLEAVVLLVLHSVVLGHLTIHSDDLNGIQRSRESLYLIEINAVLLLSIFSCSSMQIYNALDLGDIPYLFGLLALCVPTVALSSLQYQQVQILRSFSYGGHQDDVQHTLRKTSSCLLAGLCICCILFLFKGALTYKLYYAFAWTIYKNIAADLRVKKFYERFQGMTVLLKFDALFFIAGLIQMIWWADRAHQSQYRTVFIVFASVMLLALYLTYKVIQLEMLWATCLALCWYAACLAIFSWSIFLLQKSATQQHLSTVQTYLTVINGWNILMCITTIYLVWTCMLNFHKGLRPYLQ